MNTGTRQGFLILADITGFTSFVASTELEHSQEILQHVLKGIISFLTPTFTLAEVEGDAVFVYSRSREVRKEDGEQVLSTSSRGDMILDIIESVYFQFRDTKTALHRKRSCNCKACQMATGLDLKFIVHYGEYVMNNVGGKDKPLGTSVNLVHRLLKNNITEATGWKAYALLTKDCVDTLQINCRGLHAQTETYEHIGAIETFSIDLDERYKTFLSNRRVYLSPEDADFIIQKDFPIAPPLMWGWMNDPAKRSLWSAESDWHIGLRPSGRIGSGSTNHCVNSKVIEKILDYRPFDYYTSSMGRGPFNVTVTNKFEPLPTGTRLSWHVKIHSFLPKVITRFICKLLLEKGIKIHQGWATLLRLIEESMSNEKQGAINNEQ